MNDLERIKELEIEVDRLKDKYNPITSEELEIIATLEYQVERVVSTSVVRSCGYLGIVIPSQQFPKRLFIFYYTLFESLRRFVLGHEIGHVALNHHNSELERQIKEYEAAYFSARLNSVSLKKLKFYIFMYGMAQYMKLPPEVSNLEGEVESLKNLGIPIDVIATLSRKVV